jgi:hypothetical protein
VNTGTGATVINLDKHRPQRGGDRQIVQGRWTPMEQTPPGPRPLPLPKPAEGEPGSRDDILALLANDAEAFFNAVGRSLTDPQAAAVYTRTIGFVGHILDGAVAQGILTQQQRDELAVLLVGLMEAPRHV